VDLGTSSVAITRELAAEVARRGAVWVDAPVARTRAAAEAGTLAVMVGSEAQVFARLRPLIGTFANDITLCGPVGCVQVVKILNNMVLFETVVAISEAKAIGERAASISAAVRRAVRALPTASLRSHGIKRCARRISTRLLGGIRARTAPALQLARETGVDTQGARRWTLVRRAIEAGPGRPIIR
jgi:3-hydroxyisobutyrate dehydrogenase-like beta-hydroxyacid dehydrogenase